MYKDREVEQGLTVGYTPRAGMDELCIYHGFYCLESSLLLPKLSIDRANVRQYRARRETTGLTK